VAADDEALRVRVITGPYFLGTKFGALFERGNSDVIASHDMEDIVTLIDGREELLSDVIACNDGLLQSYIATSFRTVLASPYIRDAVEGHLSRGEAVGRIDRILNIMSALARLSGHSAT